MGYKLVKGATIGAVSALGLAAAMNATAVEFEAGDTTVDLYGFARFAASYDFNEDISSGGQSGAFNLIDTDDNVDENEGHFGADAFTSRLGVRVNTANDVTINLEGDWDGGGGDTSGFRLRQAWGEWNNILAGQTWSNYSSFVGATPTVDFDSTAGKAGLQGREAQVRYTMGDFSVSLEEPKGTAFIDGDGAVSPDDSDAAGYDLPTFTARYESSAGPLSYAFGGMVHRADLEFDDTADGGTIDVDETGTGYAGFVAASFAATQAVTLNGTFNYSDGGNAYLYRSGNEFAGPDFYIDPDGDFEAIEGIGAQVGVSVAAGPGSFNVAYGFTELDWDDAEDDGLTVGGEREMNTNAFVNYIWNPTEAVTYGVELGYHEVENVDGSDGDTTRALFLAQYNF